MDAAKALQKMRRDAVHGRTARLVGLLNDKLSEVERSGSAIEAIATIERLRTQLMDAAEAVLWLNGISQNSSDASPEKWRGGDRHRCLSN